MEKSFWFLPRDLFDHNFFVIWPQTVLNRLAWNDPNAQQSQNTISSSEFRNGRLMCVYTILGPWKGAESFTMHCVQRQVTWQWTTLAAVFWQPIAVWHIRLLLLLLFYSAIIPDPWSVCNVTYGQIAIESVPSRVKSPIILFLFCLALLFWIRHRDSMGVHYVSNLPPPDYPRVAIA